MTAIGGGVSGMFYLSASTVAFIVVMAILMWIYTIRHTH